MKLLLIDYRNTKEAESVGEFGDAWLLNFKKWIFENFSKDYKVIDTKCIVSAKGEQISFKEILSFQQSLILYDDIFVCDAKTIRFLKKYLKGHSYLELPSPYFFGSVGSGELLKVKYKIQDHLKMKGTANGYHKKEKVFG